jgi:hypothetical protein
VHLRLIGIVPDLIETFTPQVDSYRERACRVYHAMTSTAINLLWQLAGNAVGSAVAPWIDPGESLWWVQPTLAGGKRFGRGGEASPIEAYKGLNHQAGLGKEMQLQGMSTWYINLPMLHYQSYEGIIHDTVVGKFLNIKGGMGLGTMCAAEGGDFKDNNPANIKKLNELLPEKFSGIRKNLRDMFSHLYHGHVDIPGEPSLMAKTILTKAWFGPGSVTDFLEDTIPMERYLLAFVPRRFTLVNLSRADTWSVRWLWNSHPGCCPRATTT